MALSRHGNREESPKAKINKDSIKEALVIFRYVKPYRRRFIGGLMFIALSAANTMTFPYLLYKLIDSATGRAAGFFVVTPAAIALTMLCLQGLQMIISFFRIYLFTSVGENAVADMRKDIYRQIIMMPMDFFAQRRVGELSSRITADVSQIQDAVTTVFAELLRGILTLIASIVLIWWINKKMTLLMLSVVPVVVVIALIFSRFIRRISRQAQDQLADSGTVVQETLQGIANVKSFSNEWYEIDRYNKSVRNVVTLGVKNGRFRGMFVSTMLFTVFGTIILVIWYGVMQMQGHLLTIGGLTSFVVYTAFLGGTLTGFADQYSQLQKTVGATQRVRELLKEPTEQVIVTNIPADPEFIIHGDVVLDHIKFSYPTRREVTVVKDISIHAKRGEQVAIVGPSGAGKSTLISLLLRFYDPDAGEIRFDGHPAGSIPLTQLRKQLALVPQDILLFGGTIYENIAYGNPGSTLDEVKDAARKANAHDFIMHFPDGYDTVVGERGTKLSGGQRQRIAIARAILKDPVILLLDEATSSLDSESEALVHEALDNLMANRTSFIIAHRLSTIRKADQIIVLEDGIVKESGTHDELIKIDEGLYRNLSRLQLFEDGTA